MITFANSYIRPGEGDISPTITIDAYSSAKTVRGAISDFGRYILKHLGLAEGEWFIKDKKDMLFPMSESDKGYFLEVGRIEWHILLSYSHTVVLLLSFRNHLRNDTLRPHTSGTLLPHLMVFLTPDMPPDAPLLTDLFPHKIDSGIPRDICPPDM